MRKSTRIVKKSLALFLVVLMSINTFAAVVGDNDGAAFITKAEFDSLKNDFQSQLDRYNSSIDNKIDGAIAAYLAGIRISKTTTEKFFDGQGRQILIFDSTTIDDLKRGKPEFTYDGLNAMGDSESGTQYTGLYSISYVKLKRTADNSSSFEVFAINEETATEHRFLFYSDDFAFKIVASAQGRYYGGYTPWHSDPGSNFLVRWHGQANDRNGAISVETTARTGNPSNGIFSRYLSHPGFWNMSVSGVLHDLPAWSTNLGNAYNVYTEKVSLQNKITLAMHRATAKSQLWAHMITDHPETTWVYAAKEITNYNNTADMEKKYPSDANVSSDGSILDFVSMLDAYDPSQGRNSGSLTPLVWADDGHYASTTTPENSRLPWQEPGILLDNLNPKTIILDDIPENIKSTYASYGWHGRLTEGLPIALFEKDGSVKFKLNTSTLENDIVFALATSPTYFQNLSSTQLLKDAPLPMAISDYKVDGVDISTGATTLAPGEHTIEFKISLDSTKVPLFFKIEFPNSNTSKLRKSFVLPEEFEFTSE